MHVGCWICQTLGIPGLDQLPKISGEILLFPPAELSLYPCVKMVQSIQGEAKWEMVGTSCQLFGLMTSAWLFWLTKQCDCL